VALKTVEVTLLGKDDQPYDVKITQLPAERAHKFNVRVLQKLSLGGAKGKDWGAVLAAISGVLDDEEFIRKELFANMFVNGIDMSSKEAFNRAFNGDLPMAYRVMAESLRVNFDDFFGGKLGVLAELAKTKMGQMESRLKVSITSSGPSTESSKTAPVTEPSTTGKPASA
jgi:hypothetical protein